jgi:hypothetical protein
VHRALVSQRGRCCGPHPPPPGGPITQWGWEEGLLPPHGYDGDGGTIAAGERVWQWFTETMTPATSSRAEGTEMMSTRAWTW